MGGKEGDLRGREIKKPPEGEVLVYFELDLSGWICHPWKLRTLRMLRASGLHR